MSLTYVGAITGRDISNAAWRSTVKYEVCEAEQKIATESAVSALGNPFAITESQN